MIVLGLTGGIGSGKSTTLGLFAEAGCAVWDADAAVHRLYAPGGAGVARVEAAFPGVTVEGGVDRARLAAALGSDPAAFARLEALVHPLVRADRERFVDTASAAVAILDVPLLFEGGGAGRIDAVVVCDAPEALRRARVLARPGMTEARLEALLARQLPQARKVARADFVVDTSKGIEAARARVRDILARVTAPDWTPAPKPAT